MKNKNEKTSSRTFTLWIKTLAYLLSILLIFYAVPANVYAELIETVESALDNTSEETIVEEVAEEIETKKAVFEVTDRREETVKHFRTEDGSFTAVQYGIPVHEKDENGEWQDIDNTLSDTGSDYATSNARVKFAKKTTGNETLFTLHDGNRKITMSLSGSNKKVTGQVTNTQTEFSEDATQIQKLMTLDKLSSKILYPDILDGVDLEYVVNSGNIKENIIVKERANSYSYTFELELNNLDVELCEDGSIVITDPDTDEVVYTIPKGYMYDAAGEYSDAVTYTLTNGGNGKYSLTVTADAEWIDAEGRAFPVTVDPPINATPDASYMTDTYITNTAPNTTYYPSAELKSGSCGNDEYMAFWRTSNIPSLPENAYLVKACFMMDCIRTGYPYTYNFATKIGIYNLSSSNWTSGLTWNNRGNSFVADDNDLVDFVDIEAATDTAAAANWVSWDITSLYTQWLSDPTSNHGLALVPIGEKKDYAVFSSANSTTYIPCIIVEYRDMKGIESYWSGSTHSAGLAGSGFVNHATGDLVFSVGTLSTTDGLFGYTPSIIYNSAITDEFYRNANNPNVYYPTITAGMGLKLSTKESVLEGSYVDKNGNVQTYFVWSDSDGTEHYFLYDEVEQTTVEDPYDREYWDEDGLRLSLSIVENTTGYNIIITHSDGSSRVFNATLSDNKVGGVIEYLQDRYGNRLYLSAPTDTANKTVVKVLPSGQTEAIEYMTFTYHSMLGQLMEIRDSVSGYVVQIEYGSSAADDAVISSTCCGPLRRIKFGHLVDSTVVVDRTVSYGYTHCTDGLYRLSWARDDDAKAEIRYEYDSLGRVIKVSEIAYTTENNEEVENLGQSVSFTYGIGYTEVRSSGEDDILQTGTDSDDIITHYTLDRYGRAISAYSTNAARTAMYGATNNAYEAPSEKNEDNNPIAQIPVYSTSKNSIKTASVVNSVSANYVYNGSFESISSIGNDYVPLGWLLGGNVTMLEDETEPSTEPNVNGVTIKNPEIDLPSSITQYVILPNGTYTLSAKCIAGYCENAIAEMIVDSISDNDPPYVAEIRHSDITDTITESEPVLTFEANGTSGNSETFAITFQISQMADTTACEGSVTIDEVMLTQNIGAAQYNMIQNGSFDGAAYNSVAVTQNLLGNVWQYDFNDAGSSWATIQTVDSDFDKCLVISGDVNEYRTYGQTVIPPALDGRETTDKRRTFILSGFGKGSANVANEEAYFSIDVDVYYANSTVPQRFYFDFNKDTEDWQFLSATFSTHRNKIIDYIVIYCTYAHQSGEAYFDEISLVEASGGTAVAYDYDSEGRMTMAITTDKVTYYEYDDSASHNEPVRIIDSQNNLTELTYSATGILRNEKIYKYEPNEGISVYDFDTLLEYKDDGETYKNVTLEGIGRTTYSIDNYGLKYATMITSLADSNTQTLYSNTEYDTTAGSRTFGRPLRAVTTSGQAIRYQYNDKGLLIAEFTEGQGGLYYTYDVLGRTSQVLPYIYLGTGDLYYANDIMASASYTYDEKYRLSSITTESTTYHFTYDEFGNTNQILVGNIPLVTYEYAANNGKLQKMTYGNDNFVEYSYDELDRLAEVCYTYTDSSGNLVNNSYLYTYTTTGALHSVKSTEANREYFCVRDSEGKAIFYNENDATDGTELLKISYEYDEQNRLSDQYQMISYTAPGNLVSASYHLKVKYNTDDTLQTYSIKLGASNVANLAYTYDGLDRIKTKTVTGGAFYRTESYTYKPRGGLTTYQIGTYTSTTCGTSTTYSYTYDNNGNITHVTDGDGLVTRYIYDNLGQLIREENPYLGKTYSYYYDFAGNLLSKTTYAYSAESSYGTATSTQNYTYNSDSTWGDQLSGYTYDEIGNPSYYNGYVLTWSGRQLMEMSMNGGQFVYRFTYNADGIRTSKNVNGTVHTYTLNGTQVVSETWGQRMLVYLYDESGSPIGLQYRQSSYAAGVFDTYYFEKNWQGDILAVYTDAGVKIGSYVYDAWGNCTVTVASGVTSVQSSVVRNYNPFRYRGYFYDYETGLYYLQSRYYNPATGRFINADGYINANGDLIGFNMYAYCSNNPVMCVDYSGKFAVASMKNEAIFPGMISVGVGGVYCGVAAGSATYNKCIQIKENVKEDIKNYDKYNESESKVLQSNYFSSYKGVLVLRIPGERSGSLGIIFLTYESNRRDNPEDIVRHEFGHTVQLERLGLVKYLLCIGLPSWQEWGSKDYYDKPWEVTADIYGGVQSREASSSDKADAFYYLWFSEQVGPFAWRTID